MSLTITIVVLHGTVFYEKSSCLLLFLVEFTCGSQCCRLRGNQNGILVVYPDFDRARINLNQKIPGVKNYTNDSACAPVRASLAREVLSCQHAVIHGMYTDTVPAANLPFTLGAVSWKGMGTDFTALVRSEENFFFSTS